VRADDTPPPAAGPPPRAAARWSWLLPLAIAAALVAAGGWGLEARRSSQLADEVTRLDAALQAAQAEIGARTRHLASVRSAAARVEEEMAALRALAEQDPRSTPAPALPAQLPPSAE
jgi:hypothetical protein